MEQYILRNETGELPVMDKDGYWTNAEEVINYGSVSGYMVRWLFTRLMMTRNPNELEGQVFPISQEELYEILEDSKECVHEKEESLNMKLFDCGLFYCDFDYELTLKVMGEFNRTMAGKLRNKKKVHYFYWFG